MSDPKQAESLIDKEVETENIRRAMDDESHVFIDGSHTSGDMCRVCGELFAADIHVSRLSPAQPPAQGEAQKPAGHAFVPDKEQPLHCAVCWQYAAWWQHKIPVSPPDPAEAQKRCANGYCQHKLCDHNDGDGGCTFKGDDPDGHCACSGFATEPVETQGEAKDGPVDDANVMKVWRECGLPEYFLGNGGTNRKLVNFANRFRSEPSPERWIATSERLPEEGFGHDFLVWVKCNNKQGGYRDLAAYGDYVCEMEDPDRSDPRYVEDDDDGNWRGSGWHREEETHGGPYDTVFIDLNEKVTHWQPAPLPPSPDQESGK